ncbi:MAG: hypothetical protein D6701_11915, partial [Gemmatimonadetes bacterium]
RAAALDPQGTEGLYWGAAARGRMAMDAGGGRAVRLVAEARALAERVLAADSLHAGAHHVLGKIDLEIRKLSGLKRWLGHRMDGGAVIADASWERARAHLERAVALDPEEVVYRLDLGDLLERRGEKEAAAAQFEAALSAPRRHPFDAALQAEARARLDRLTGEAL